MTLQLYKNYYIRPDTYDFHIINELSTYKCFILDTNDIVLDIGGNIGSFSKFAATIAKQVISLEPDPDNFSVLQLNAPNSLLINAAVVKEDTGDIILYKNKHKNKGLHSTVPYRGREQLYVHSRSFRSLLDEFKPTKIKCDCEGAEYDFFEPELLAAEVTGVMLEIHVQKKGQREQGKQLCQRFIDAGFSYVKEPAFKDKSWGTLACFKRI